MQKLPFTISAKTARLIGRENVSNAEGAIAELVKNSYDADATLCVIYFKKRYLEPPLSLTYPEYQWLAAKGSGVENYYQPGQNACKIRNFSNGSENRAANDAIGKIVDLWIVDNGTGMNARTIEEQWMMIGTNYKEINEISDQGRTRTGAKGIGRFALDRLGSTCQLHSTTENCARQSNSITWEVDWNLFEGADRALNEITADLRESGPTVYQTVKWLFSNEKFDQYLDANFRNEKSWKTGTSIQIGLLRDEWTESETSKLNQSLATLIPPAEQRELNLYFFDQRTPERYGEIAPEFLHDYDYRIDAKVLETKGVQFQIVRNELDHGKLEPELFEMKEMREPPFDAESFKNKQITYSKSFSELFPGPQEEFLNALSGVGPLDVSLMFFKRGRPSRRDSKRYPYKNFQPGPRKAWLDRFGGIKIYRDEFLVRPYGEVDGKSFDWLTLGRRVAVSPVAASRKGWKVAPQNITGTISLSRINNPMLDDQANREGIIENKYFSAFKDLIIRIVQEFEDDRSHIHHNLNELYKHKHKPEQAKADLGKLVEKIKRHPTATVSTKDAQAVVRAYGALQEDAKELHDEQVMLRALSTLGTVLVSFSHEMAQLQNAMSSRSSELAKILRLHFPDDYFAETFDAFNPFTILQDWERDDQKVEQWFTFALASVQSDRRKRKWTSVRDHLNKLKQIWAGILEPRYIRLDIGFADDSDPKILAFEIDLDSVFNNLILNSIEAFLFSMHAGSRRIKIFVRNCRDSEIEIEYTDNGPGLHPSIKNPRDIFKFAVSTKVDSKGSSIGTGLGMWILDSVVSSYGGSAKAYAPSSNYGFRMELKLPAKT